MATDPRLLEFARRMRREPTPTEEKLWRELRGRKLGGFKFRRQSPLAGYIADFLSVEAKLVIELDGDSHAEAAALDYDRIRLRLMNEIGFEVLRFWNCDLHDNLQGVLDDIQKKCNERIMNREAFRSDLNAPPHPP